MANELDLPGNVSYNRPTVVTNTSTRDAALERMVSTLPEEINLLILEWLVCVHDFRVEVSMNWPHVRFVKKIAEKLLPADYQSLNNVAQNAVWNAVISFLPRAGLLRLWHHAAPWARNVYNSGLDARLGPMITQLTVQAEFIDRFYSSSRVETNHGPDDLWGVEYVFGAELSGTRFPNLKTLYLTSGLDETGRQNAPQPALSVLPFSDPQNSKARLLERTATAMRYIYGGGSAKKYIVFYGYEGVDSPTRLHIDSHVHISEPVVYEALANLAHASCGVAYEIPPEQRVVEVEDVDMQD